MFKRAAAGLLLLCLAAPLSAKDKPSKHTAKAAGPVELTKEGDSWARKTLKKLSVEEKVGQILSVVAYAEFENTQSPDFTRLTGEIQQYHLGSVILTVHVRDGMLRKGGPYDAAMMTNALQEASKLPLLVSADFERGASMRMTAVPDFPAAMAFGATGKPEYAGRFAQIVARESRAMGVQWNFFPVADVNSNPLNPIINIRSYGADPEQVSDFVEAYIKGSREGGMLSTAKHFPGHGDTDRDTHVEFARVNGDMDRLNQVELKPFERAISAGVDSIMVAHVTAPAIDPRPLPATLSSKVVTDLLKGQLHFQGIVVTDAMDMGALTSAYKSRGDTDPHQIAGLAAVDAFKAGNDMILMPSDIEGAYDGLLQAVKSGDIPEARLDESVLKVLRAKASLGLNKDRFVDVDSVSQLVGRPEDMAFAQQVADESVTLVRDNQKAIPLVRAQVGTAQSGMGNPGTAPTTGAYTKLEGAPPSPSTLVAVVLNDDLRSESGRAFEDAFRKHAPGAEIFTVDPDVAGPMLNEINAAVANAKAVVVAAYSVPQSGKVVQTANGLHNTVSLTSGNADVVDSILKMAADKTVMIALGNPYLALDFPSVQTYVCTFSNTATSERAAVKTLFGDVPYRGHLPVSLPGIAERGFGVVSAQDATSGAGGGNQE